MVLIQYVRFKSIIGKWKWSFILLHLQLPVAFWELFLCTRGVWFWHYYYWQQQDSWSLAVVTVLTHVLQCIEKLQLCITIKIFLISCRNLYSYQVSQAKFTSNGTWKLNVDIIHGCGQRRTTCLLRDGEHANFFTFSKLMWFLNNSFN